MLEDNFYQMMESLPLTELECDYGFDWLLLLLEGVRQYLQTPADNPDYFWSGSTRLGY